MEAKPNQPTALSGRIESLSPAKRALLQRRLNGTLEREGADYWRDKLRGAPPLLEVPTDNPRTNHSNHRRAVRTLRFSSELSDSFSRLCLNQGVTQFMGWLAVFKVLLARISGQDDIIVRAPATDVSGVAVRDLNVSFANTVVLRTDVSGNVGFTEILKRVKATTREAYEQRARSPEILIEPLRPDLPSGNYPQFQFHFDLANTPPAAAELVGLELEGSVSEKPGTGYEIALHAMEANCGILLRASYNADLYEDATIQRLLEQLELLLEQIVISPQQPIHAYSLIRVEDLHHLPDPTVALTADDDVAIHHVFELQAGRTPNRTALVDADGSWSYAELNDTSDRLAQFLRRQGVARGEVVAVYATASASLVHCLLGILKAGAAFLILDAAYPEARLRRYLEIANPVALLNLESAGPLPGSLEQFAATSRCRCEVPRQKAQVLASLRPGVTGGDASAVSGRDAAYVLFTSGSTGEPLGIRGTHRPVSHFLRWHIQTFGFDASDRFSLLSGIGHDILQRDVFTPLWLGASLHIPAPEQRDSSDVLAHWLEREKITVTHLTPALAELLCEPASAGRMALSQLRWMFFGGDRLTHGLVQRVRRSATACQLVNFYGATETPQAMSYELIDPNIAASRPPHEGVAIGRGIDGAQLLLINRAGKLAGVGELAEIYVRSPYLGAKYLKESPQTIDRFSANPFLPAPGEIIYRTGDMGRYLANGHVAFVGRRDQQAKLRGFRIELGEVEAALRNCAGVRDSVVVVAADEFGEKQLVAYVVPAQCGFNLTARHIRTWLKKCVPAYVIPSCFFVISAVPLTPNGKVDRKATEKLDRMELAAGAEYVGPRHPVETEVVSIWEALLNRQPIGIHDNFFDLGGHSLLAIRFSSLLRERRGVDLPIRVLFEAPTPATLAEQLMIFSQTAGPPASREEPIERPDIGDTLEQPASSRLTAIDEILKKQLAFLRTWKGRRLTPNSFIVSLNTPGRCQGLFWCLQGYRELSELAKHLGADQPVHGMRSGYLVMEYTQEACAAIAAVYAAEMIALQPEGSFLLGGNCQGGKIARTIAQQLRALGRKVSLLILMEQDSFEPWDGQVALIFGRASHFNPYRSNAEPEAAFHNAYPAGFTLDLIAGQHGEFFQSPNIETLAWALSRRLPKSSMAPPIRDLAEGVELA